MLKSHDTSEFGVLIVLFNRFEERVQLLRRCPPCEIHQSQFYFWKSLLLSSWATSSKFHGRLKDSFSILPGVLPQLKISYQAGMEYPRLRLTGLLGACGRMNLVKGIWESIWATLSPAVSESPSPCKKQVEL